MAEQQDVWTIKAALDWTCGYLERKGDENPRLSAEWLLAEACDMRRIELYVNFERPLSMSEREVLRGYVTRRGRGEPLQYITGEVGFRHITVHVRPGVLIPRPETEVLVSELLAELPAPERLRALDSTMSAAEGDAVRAQQVLAAFQVSLDEDREGAVAQRAFAGESSSGAAGESREATASAPAGEGVAFDEGASAGNSAFAGASAAAAFAPECAGNSASVRAELASDPAGDAALAGAGTVPAPADNPSLLVADVCTGSGCIACSVAYEHPAARVVATDIAPEAVALARENVRGLGLEDRVSVIECSLGEGVDEALLGSFDAVASNPPYIPTAVLADIPREVTDFEPALALDGGQDGLDLFRPLAAWAHRALKPGGVFAVELHEGHLDAAADVARAAGFTRVRIVRDLADKPRVLVARKG